MVVYDFQGQEWTFVCNFLRPQEVLSCQCNVWNINKYWAHMSAHNILLKWKYSIITKCFVV